jgi:hypothetical protein
MGGYVPSFQTFLLNDKTSKNTVPLGPVRHAHFIFNYREGCVSCFSGRTHGLSSSWAL